MMTRRVRKSPAFAAALVLGLGAAGPAHGAPAKAQTAVFAGGCFWCTESDFEHVPGVLSAVSGYTGGTKANPNYESHEGYSEAVKVTFDPSKVSYRALVDRFWRTVDVTDLKGQFCDRGPSYAPAVFVASPEQRKEAEASLKAASAALKKPIAVPIRDLGPFYVAEGYHQDFYKKNVLRYRIYRQECGRDRRLKEVWGGR
jgi:peptide-methionine (S)-S-oxide reductase